MALPAARAGGAFFESRSPLDTAWGDVIQAVLTPIGRRPMARSFGSAIYELLFEPNGEENESLVEDAVADAVSRWVPSVNIEYVRVNTGSDRRINLVIGFSLVSSGEQDERLVQVDRRNKINAVRGGI